MTKIRRQECSTCGGSGEVPGSSTFSRPCGACAGTGVRFVPEGYTQAQVESVRNLVDALAVRQGLA